MVRLTRSGSPRFGPGMGEQRRKLFVALAIQQDGAALGRHHFKNQFQDLRLQLVEVRNGVNDAADFQQRVQIPSQPRSRRQFFQDAFRLKIENILGPNLRRGLGQVSSNSTAAGTLRRLSSFSRNTKTDSPTEIWSPCFNCCLRHQLPFTNVPLRLSRSRSV